MNYADVVYDTDPGDDPDEEPAEAVEPLFGPQTLEQFKDLHLGSLIYLWRRVLDTARESPSPHLLQYLDFERFCWLAYRLS
jgi:hypothetical protein